MITRPPRYKAKEYMKGLSKLLIITLMQVACSQNKSGVAKVTSEKPNPLSGKYEIVRSNGFFLDVYVEDTAKIAQINDKILADSNSKGDKDIVIMYFDNKSAASTFYQVRAEENGQIPHHRLAVYHCAANSKGTMERENWKP